MKVAILYNQVGTESAQDELDVITQVNTVTQALTALGYEPVTLSLSLNIASIVNQLKLLQPAFVFNLVESLAGTGRFLHFAPAILEHLQLPYTGSGSDALYLTTNKLLSKERLRAYRIATPPWMRINCHSKKKPKFPPPYIVKPVWEDASVGLNDASVFYHEQDLLEHFTTHLNLTNELFTEAYIAGREFNLSILASKEGPQVLPAAEIEFIDYPAEKPRIVDYRAKWDVNSFEYQHTVRRFDFADCDKQLIAELTKIARRCWKIFNLCGYARVDFRIDLSGKSWVLEVNTNPCISPDSGFVAASERAGLDYNTIIRRIIDDIPRPPKLQES